jgi:hypothetical protein
MYKIHGIPSTRNSVDMKFRQHGIPLTRNSIDTEFRIQKNTEFHEITGTFMELRGISRISRASLYYMYEF